MGGENHRGLKALRCGRTSYCVVVQPLLSKTIKKKKKTSLAEGTKHLLNTLTRVCNNVSAMRLAVFIFCTSLTKRWPSYYSNTSDPHVSRDQSNHSGQRECLLNRHNWPASICRKNITLTPSEQARSNQAAQRGNRLSIIPREPQIDVSGI